MDSAGWEFLFPRSVTSCGIISSNGVSIRGGAMDPNIGNIGITVCAASSSLAPSLIDSGQFLAWRSHIFNHDGRTIKGGLIYPNIGNIDPNAGIVVD